MKYIFIILFVLVSSAGKATAQSGSIPASAADWTLGGHSKFQFIYNSYPENSLFKDVLGSTATDNNLEVRMKAAATRDRWDFNIDYQFIAIHADTLRLAGGPHLFLR